MGEAVRFERRPDRADAAIHHVRRREDVAAGLGLDQRLMDQQLERPVVVDLAVDQETVMAVAGVGVERHVADDADLRHRLLDGPRRPADQIAGVERLARLFVAQ